MKSASALREYTAARPGFSTDWGTVWSKLGFESPHPKVVLDIGCGTGRSSQWLAHDSELVVAIDPDKQSIKIAEEQNSRSNIFFHSCAAEDISEVGYASRDVEAIVFSGSLDWIDIKHMKQSFQNEIGRQSPAVCIWTWFDTKDDVTREWYKFFRKWLGSNYGMDGEEVLAKAFGTVVSHRSFQLGHEALFSIDGLVSIVGSSSYWRPRIYPWNHQGLTEEVSAFYKRHSVTSGVSLKFVDVFVGGYLP